MEHWLCRDCNHEFDSSYRRRCDWCNSSKVTWLKAVRSGIAWPELLGQMTKAAQEERDKLIGEVPWDD